MLVLFCELACRRFVQIAMMEHRFSVVIPAYNAEKYLTEALESLGAQSFGDYEAVLVDDGSIDTTRQIMESYAVSHANVKVFSGPNKGPLLARRRGLCHCQGEYVLFLDADDCLRCDALEVIDDALRDTGADIVSFAFSRHSDFGRNRPTPNNLPVGYYTGASMHKIRSLLCKGMINNLATKAIRLACIDLDADYESQQGLMHGEDLFQLLPVVDKAKSLVSVDDALYYYRPNDGASTARFRPNQIRDMSVVCARLFHYAGKWGGDLFADATTGEASMYRGLVHMAVRSCNDIGSLYMALDSIRETMRATGAFVRARNAPLRFDRRVILRLLETEQYEALRMIVGLAESVR